MAVSEEILEERAQMASEQLLSDEGFLEDYLELLPEEKVSYLFRKAEDLAIKAAKNTADIEDEDKAWEAISKQLEKIRELIEKEAEQIINN